MRIAVLNDLHAASVRRSSRVASHLVLESLDRCLQLVDKAKPDLIILLGDIIQNIDNAHDEKQLRAVASRFVSRKDKTVFTMGNHESRGLGFHKVAQILLDEGFDPNLFGRRSLPGGEVLWLSSLQLGRHEERRDFLPEEQFRWLGEQVVTLDKPTLVFMHHAFTQYELGGNFYFEVGGRQDLMHILNAELVLPLLTSSPHVQAAVSGHAHWLSSVERDGLPLITLPAFSENIAAPLVDETVPDIWSLIDWDGKQTTVRVYSGEYAFAYLELNRR